MGPAGNWGGFDAVRMRVFHGGQLYREVADGGAFHCTTAYFQTGCVCGQAVQESVAAAAAYDIDPPQLLSCNMREVAHDFSISGGETVENEAGHLRRGFRTFRHRLQSSPLELAIDAGRHFSGQQQVWVIYIQ